MAQASRPVRHQRQMSRLTTARHLGEGEHTQGNAQATPTSDAADRETMDFVKQRLCVVPLQEPGAPADATHNGDATPLNELLPKLTSNSALDVQLYALLAIILSQLVQSWYNKITPDGDFVHDILKIIAHCTQGVEERLSRLDIESLLLDELPALLDAHLHAARIAFATKNSPYGGHTDSQVRGVYQAMLPRNALSPLPLDETTMLAQRENEVDWSQAFVNAIMPLVLPAEDFVNPCLDVLVSEIFSELIIRNAILGKLSEPWLIWEGVTKAIYAIRPKVKLPNAALTSPTSRLEHFGLLSEAGATGRDTTGRRTLDVLGSRVWSIMQYAAIAWMLLRAFTSALIEASSFPPRQRVRKPQRSSSTSTYDAVDSEAHPQPHDGVGNLRPIIGMSIWTCVGRCVDLPSRMPWLHGCLSLLQQLSIRSNVCGTDSIIDRLMSAEIRKRISNPGMLPSVMRSIRKAAFPNDAFPGPRQPPTSEEVAEIKRQCAAAIVDNVPKVAMYYFATKDEETMQRDVEEVLDVLGDAYINKHLIVAALELLAVRLFPELIKADIVD